MSTPSLHSGTVCFCHHLFQLPCLWGGARQREPAVCPTQLSPDPPAAVPLEAAGAHGCNGAPSYTRHWFLRHGFFFWFLDFGDTASLQLWDRFLFLTGTAWLTFPLLRDSTQKCVGTFFLPWEPCPLWGVSLSLDFSTFL